MANPRRVYVVVESVKEGVEQRRLVEAVSQAQAVSHVVRGKFVASVASQAELVSLLTSGAKVEKAGDSAE